jgi:hypothetical protein
VSGWRWRAASGERSRWCMTSTLWPSQKMMLIGRKIIKRKEAREFNYRKVILVIEEDQISRLNAILRFDNIRFWLDAWSIKSVYELYTNGQKFFSLYDKLKEARYRERKELNLI